MKYLLLCVVICNQVVYDQIYMNLVLNAKDKGATVKAMEERNNAIELLRKLCNNQRSTWEGQCEK